MSDNRKILRATAAGCWLAGACLTSGLAGSLAAGIATMPAFAEAGTSARATEADTEARFLAAMDALERGNIRVAQRQLELLIASHPDSPFANAARRKVAPLYSGGAASGLVALPPPARPPTAAVPTASSQAPADAMATAGAGPLPGADGWRVEVRPAGWLDPAIEDFRARASDRVFFPAGSAALGARARAVLREQARWLAANPGVDVRIEGHADDPGSASDNDRLATERAAMVREALVAEGIAAERVLVAGLGRSEPVAPCPEPECATQNRRVVTRLAPSLGEMRPAAGGPAR